MYIDIIIYTYKNKINILYIYIERIIIDEIFLSLKTMTPSSYTLLRNRNRSFLGEIRLAFTCIPFLDYMRPKTRNDKRVLYW
jgi:hypothetical protein